MQRSALILLFTLVFYFPIFSQSDYDKAWKALDEADVEKALEYFEAATKKSTNKESALLCLTVLESHRNQEERSTQYFKEFMKISENPYPEIYTLWFNEGVAGSSGKKTEDQVKFLNYLENREDNKGKLDAATYYRMLTHHVMSFDQKKARKHFKKIKNIDDWLFLGPFDNVMNSGYDKDFGVLAQPELEATFVSKYGAPIQWFDPPSSAMDGYTFKDMYFKSSSSIIYAQTFVESPDEQEVLVKFGYSGSLKVWINDQLLYTEPERRETEMDYFRFKCTLNKGYNRIVIQLGDHEEYTPNFTMRLTDLSHNPLQLSNSNDPKPYDKQLKSVEQIPYFAIEELKEKTTKGNDPLYNYLLARAYMRSNELNKAEAVLKKAVGESTLNYFYLRGFINLYAKANNSTNQNKYYEVFEENYPNDKYILENKIEEHVDKKEKDQARKLINLYLSKYSNPYFDLRYSLNLTAFKDDNEGVIRTAEKLYKKFPDDYMAMTTKYNLEKSFYADPDKANKVLEKYLKTNYNYNIVNELAKNYFDKGQIDDALKLLKKGIKLVPYSTDASRSMVNVYSRQSRYDEAIVICKELIKDRPSDYLILKDLAVLYAYKNNKTKALEYYEQALQFFPFSFETNEKIRELKGLTKAIDLIPETDPIEAIQDFEKNYKAKVKRSYDVAMETKSMIIYKSRATGIVHRYILRLNDEKALDRWQHINLGASGYMNMYIDEVQTIKKNGQKISADRNGAEVVFTNLEVGDYVYVSFFEKQYSGGKSSAFVSDRFSLNSYAPVYKIEYNLYAEEGVPASFEFLHSDKKPTKSEKEGFVHYNWLSLEPEIIKQENFPLPFHDIAEMLHISLDHTWKDIVQWYSDLSAHQATPDFTIKELVNEMFNGKKMTDDEKARTIYEFVCKNIQYSSIDFRQSGYIPQKASKIFHSRLGDCKDVSTLYVSLARAAGLKANLVLINTRDNGQKDVIMPSLNFNHCIVKVYLDEGDKYLELTDPDLPYGHLYYYHQGASILEILTEDIPDDIQLEYLKLNSDFNSHVYRDATIKVTDALKLEVNKKTIKTGRAAAASVRGYYYTDPDLRKDKIKQAIGSSFKSSVSMTSLDYDILEPRRDSIKYSYGYLVDNEVLKLGSLRTFKVPFADNLFEMSLFEDEARVHTFNFIYFENTDFYEEKIVVTLDDKFSYKEVPKNMHEEYNGNVYDLKFKKINAQQMEILRTYKVNRENISPENFPAFKEFISKINEGENAHLLFQ